MGRDRCTKSSKMRKAEITGEVGQFDISVKRKDIHKTRSPVLLVSSAWKGRLNCIKQWIETRL